MSSSPDRAQTEPLAALAAVLAVSIGLALYVDALDTTLPLLTTEREMAPIAADRLLAEASSFGVVELPLGDAASEARPTGYRLNATLRADGTETTTGPPRAPSADCVARRVTARVAPGRVRPARLEVCVWRAQ